MTDGFSRRIILFGVSLHYYIACVFEIIIDLEPYLIAALNTYMYSLFFYTFFFFYNKYSCGSYTLFLILQVATV